MFLAKGASMAEGYNLNEQCGLSICAMAGGFKEVSSMKVDLDTVSGRRGDGISHSG